MVYKGLSYGLVSFGLSVFWLSYEIVRFQQTAPEIISVILFGLIGAVMAVMGLFGLWEIRKKGGNLLTTYNLQFVSKIV